MTTKISVTRALTELKVLSDRIENAAYQPLLAVKQNGKPRTGNRTIQELENDFKANLQSVTALIERRKILKTKVVESNAATKVTISGVEMTVADAIERKQSIASQQVLLNSMVHSLAQHNREVERINIDVQARAEKLLSEVVGKDRKATQEEIETVTGKFLQDNLATLIDPNNISDQISKLRNEIDGFLMEVDFVLSESNAITTIEV